MKILFFCFIFLLSSCGKDSNSKHNKSQDEMAKLGIGTTSKCMRAELVRGTNSQFSWQHAAIGNLQEINVSLAEKSVGYVESREPESFHNKTFFTQVQNSLFFKTTTKSLKLTFHSETGYIENDLTEYVVANLTYDDNSGYLAKFLCTK